MAKVNNVSTNTTNTTKEATMNLNTMKKADLINMIKSQEEIIKALTNENNELKNALVEIKVATKTFISHMNGVYVTDAVKTATTTNITNSADDVKVEEERKEAPKPEEVASKPEEHEENPKPVNKTYREGLDDWKIKKYGSIEIANRVQAMTKVVAAEWREEAKKTGKYVVAKKDYKNKLYEVAYDRVKKEMEEETKKNANK